GRCCLSPSLSLLPYRHHLAATFLAIGLFAVSLGCQIWSLRYLHRALPPGNWHRRRLAMAVFSLLLWPIFEPGDEIGELLDGLVVAGLALFRRRQLCFAQHAIIGIAAGPRCQRRRAVAEEVNIQEGTIFAIEADFAAFDLVFADVVAVQVEIERRFQLTGVGA